MKTPIDTRQLLIGYIWTEVPQKLYCTANDESFIQQFWDVANLGSGNAMCVWCVLSTP